MDLVLSNPDLVGRIKQGALVGYIIIGLAIIGLLLAVWRLVTLFSIRKKVEKQIKNLDAPILAGISRKSMLYKTLNISAQEALNATTSANTIALLNGANVLRVHDVKEAIEAVKIVNQIN